MKKSTVLCNRLSRLPGWIMILVPVMLAAGCNEARWRDASVTRQERIKRLSGRYAAHDAAGPQRIHTTVGFARKMEETHRQNLAYTTDLICRTHERDVNRWQEEAPYREEMIRKQWNARPETIPDTWARMVY